MINFIDLRQEKKSRLIFNKSGNYLVFTHNLSGKFLFEIKASGVNLNIYGIFIGKGKDKFNLETIQHHKAPSSFSNLLIKGVFYDYSQFNFNGLIRIEKNAQKTHAYQKNQNLLLSPFSVIESNPNLEILANDVFCTHGSTTGKLNESQLFYLTSRSLNQKQASLLLLHGFVNEVFDKMRKLVDFRLFQKSFLEIESLLNKDFHLFSFCT